METAKTTNFFSLENPPTIQKHIIRTEPKPTIQHKPALLVAICKKCQRVEYSFDLELFKDMMQTHLERSHKDVPTSSSDLSLNGYRWMPKQPIVPPAMFLIMRLTNQHEIDGFLRSAQHKQFWKAMKGQEIRNIPV